MAEYWPGEHPIVPAIYSKGRLCPYFFICSDCYEATDNRVMLLPWDEEDRRDVLCPKCGAPLITSFQYDMVQARKKDFLTMRRYPGWSEEEQAEEWKKWIAEHPEDADK